MKILFHVHRTSHTRHFETTVRLLAERGHTVVLAGVVKKGRLRLPASLQHPRVSILEAPDRRTDEWQDFIRPLRFARDYIGYLNPRFAHSRRLLQRAEKFAPAGFVRFCQTRPWVKRRWERVGRALKLVEDVIPGDRAVERFLRSVQPDLVLITPLVLFGGAYQTDYVKAAHRLGLPIAYLPFSWDNLTNKGLIRVIPDRVLVWNEIQGREAVELHGVPPERVVVTGAPRFDEFVALQPSGPREEFCREAGLDPAHPYILYLCSSEFVAPREVEFVRRWVAELRASDDPALRSCGVLVRPHPGNAKQWEGADLSDLPNVALQPLAAWADPDQGLYDALHHAATVVGLNTSALIEAGILGKSVHTILAPGFRGQQGTLHFHYLLEEHGGLLAEARNFDDHRRQLSAALADGAARRERSLRFVERFVRPHGLEQPAAPVMVREIERLGELRKRPRRLTPPWHYPVRWTMRAWLRSPALRAGIASLLDRGLPETLRLKDATE